MKESIFIATNIKMDQISYIIMCYDDIDNIGENYFKQYEINSERSKTWVFSGFESNNVDSYLIGNQPGQIKRSAGNIRD
ncbi:hypothetical protein AYI70_g8579 [Smittium culicis]|uniref:Uncharacterized protein n=1 Tax=Smittium culicis TaxID=133412 RepID=A0A1R1XFE0_9FUNG|nr:hypothetical protein AYI70_g8579 [Smittium culicis]